MDLKFVKYEKKDHLALVTFNRPEVMNAMHPPCHVEMDQVWDDFVADRDLWVAILTGAGDKAFSAGNDLKYTAAHHGEPMPKWQRRLRRDHRPLRYRQADHRRG